MTTLLIACTAIGLVSALAGCGGNSAELIPVTGQVLLDGEPLTTGAVITTPEKGRGAQGQIDENGNFELTTRDLGAGAVVGHHSVAVVAHEELGQGGPESPKRPLVPEKYMNPQTSGLSLDVQAGETSKEVIYELSSEQ